MKIENLTAASSCYTSHVYLVLGDWNAIDDINTLIDVGRDSSIIAAIKNRSTGVGKKPIDQVILTHSHYDHTGLLPGIQKAFSPVVCAHPGFKGADRHLKDGELIRIADKIFEIIYTPGHSNDSICIYCKAGGVLFSGDTPLDIKTCGGTYEDSFIMALEKLAKKNIKTIYPGHDAAIIGNGNHVIRKTLMNVRKSRQNAGSSHNI